MGCGIWRALGGDSHLASRPGKLRTASAVPLAQRGLKNIHATLWAAGFGAPLGATFVWPQDQASCGMFPQNLSQKGAKKHSCNPVGCGIWRALGGDFRLALRPFGSRIGPAVPLAERGLKNNHATLRAAGFGVPLGATFIWPQNQAICGLRPRHFGPKGAKKHSCNPAGCGIWRALRGDSRLASRPGKLRIESAVPLAQRALKNIHATLRAARFNASSGATVVWPQGRAICGLRSRHLGPKESKKTFMQPCGLRDLACPRGQLSFGLKAGQVADCIRGTLAQRGPKNNHATLRAARFGVPLGATVVWPQGRASCGMCPQNLTRKGSKKHSCSLADCENWHVLGSDFRLASKPGGLRIESAAP